MGRHSGIAVCCLTPISRLLGSPYPRMSVSPIRFIFRHSYLFSSMESRWVFFAVLLALASPAAAFSDSADGYMCDSAVKAAWGQAVWDQCLGAVKIGDQIPVCGLFADKQDLCTGLVNPVHPAALPNQLGLGELEQAGTCPIDKTPENQFLCSKQNLALDQAKVWLGEAASADSTCDKVYRFCVAANYLAQSYNPFNAVLFEDQKCRDVTYRKVDFALLSNQTNWGTKEDCTFDYNLSIAGGNLPKTYDSVVGINDKITNQIIANLTAEAKSLKLRSPATTTTTTTLQQVAQRDNRTYCENDSDCISVPADCCGCNAGGKKATIASAYSDEWNMQHGEDCPPGQFACAQVISQDPSCLAQPACVNNGCILKAAALETTTTTETTTSSIVTTTSAPTTTAPKPTVPPTTTTAAAEQKSGSAILIVVALALLLGGAYFIAAELGRRSRAQPEESGPRRGLRGFSGREAKIESWGSSRLSDADVSQKPRVLVPLKERDKAEKKEERPPEPPRQEEKDRNSDKKRPRSVFHDEGGSDSTLGKI